MEVLTEELVFDSERAKIVKAHGKAMAQISVRQGVRGDLVDFTPSKGLKTGQSGQSGQINFGSYREGILGVHDARNIRLLKMDASRFFGPSHDKAAKELRRLRDGNIPKTTTETRNAEKSTKPVIAGVAHVRNLAANSVHGGLDFFFSQTRSDKHIPTLVGPQQWLRWYAGGSPVTARMLQLCYTYVRLKKERVVVFVDTPWIQQ